ncbi:MAG: cobaltochelatase subunit CobS, partial [Alphaproteobacteria bacterium]|nr:cobaltochelatase subunit CobS [Alphaproteobacteria bacterium]
MSVTSETDQLADLKATKEVNVREAFGLDTDMVVHGYDSHTEYVPEI